MAVLQVENLTKLYNSRKAVNSVNFSVESGEIFGFLGANGAGKSTTLKMICGLAKITDGDVYILGNSIKYKFEDAMKEIGAIIEYPQFYEYMSGYSNLKYFAKISNVSKDRINEVVSYVGLSARINDPVKKYSLGMKQRLGIAQALLSNPKLLILDEPTNGLDANAIRELRTLLKNLCKMNKVAILISSHILPEMELICDRIAIINQGEIVELNSMSEIKKNANKYGSTFLKVNAPNYAGKLIQDNYKIKVKILDNKVLFDTDEENLAKIIVTLTQNKILVYGAGEVENSLEDIFMTTINNSGADIK